MSGEDDELSLGNLVLAAHEDRAAPLEVGDHVGVVHDLPAHVDGWTEAKQRLLDGVDRPLDPCAVAARGREENSLDHRVEA